MAVLRIVRFTTEPEQAEAMLACRAALIGATRERFEGLTETRLARVDERRWVDQWCWESGAHMQRALDAVATIPGAGEAFALIAEPEALVAEVVDDASSERSR